MPLERMRLKCQPSSDIVGENFVTGAASCRSARSPVGATRPEEAKMSAARPAIGTHLHGALVLRGECQNHDWSFSTTRQRSHYISHCGNTLRKINTTRY